jgi:hypothetical protein
MQINMEKSCMLLNNISDGEASSFLSLIPAQRRNFDEGFKYLGFQLKPDNYKKGDWLWLICKVEARIYVWTNRLLSRGGRIVLIKSMF